MKILVATSNLNKVKEIGEILKKIDESVQVLSLKDIFEEVPEIPENARTFTENALLKANWLAEKLEDSWILADDSGLVVEKLKGRPGVYSARYSGEPIDDKRNIAKLLDEMKNFTEETQRNAYFCCAMVLLSPMDKNSYVAIGKCCGKIAFSSRGRGGFGYDPIFIPDGYDKTFGELSSEIKNKISHRAKTLEILKDIFEQVIKEEVYENRIT
ncbi:MAG: RdgB/HAM1 family non-canonical purine NTP pyrophosphatase [Chitinispirillales bacterium]|jgi:XTP/dITP diphosphohydrolase|nr:RdgB/HAM1 family non-canonical purine NTP pyrophosphatase [Chitinispirillales bacterium]